MGLIPTSYDNTCAEMLDLLPERVARYRVPDRTIVYCNVAWAAGHDLRPADVIGRQLDEFLSPSERAALMSQLATLDSDNPRLADDKPRAAPNAAGQWVSWTDRFLPGADGGGEVFTVGRDVVRLHTAELGAAASETQFRKLADRSADVVWRFLIEPHPHFDYMSPSVDKFLGYPASYFLEDFSRFLDVLTPESRAVVDRAFEGVALPEQCDLRYRAADGSTVTGEMRLTMIRGGLQGVSRDVTELRAMQEELTALALRDPLTGLANRRLFQELLAAELPRAQRRATPIAVAFLDLDNLKEVNDTYGHDAGDVVLCEVARRLRSTVRGADSVARIGGDEFVIVYEPDEPSSDKLLERLDQALSVPIDIAADVAVRCPASIGTADTNAVGYDAAALLAAADAAMYRVKRARSAGTVGF